MKEYELTVLIHPGLETDLEAPLEAVRSLIKDNGGKVVREDNWGKKRLMYSIDRQDFAIYIYMELELPATAPLKINAALNITEPVLRYLLVKTDLKARAAAANADTSNKTGNETT